MPDWQRYVRDRLSLTGIRPERVESIVQDLAQILEEIFEEARAGGLSVEAAEAEARSHIPDWEQFAKALSQSEKRHALGRLERWEMDALAASESPRRWALLRWLSDLKLDLVFGLRVHTKRPGVTLMALLTLALGIGANAAIFSVVQAALFTPLPFPDAERLVMLFEHSRKRHNLYNYISPANYFDWKNRSTSFQSMSAFHYKNLTLLGEGDPARISGVAVEGDFFRILGNPPELGSYFTANPEDRRDTLVLSYQMWNNRFGADPGIVGRTLTLDGRPRLVTGIASRSTFPPGSDFWIPWEHQPDARGRYLMSLARLKQETSLSRARSEMDTLGEALEAEHPDFNTDYGVFIEPLRESYGGSFRGMAQLLLTALGFILLIACANVGGLLLGRLSARNREMAIRRAFGAEAGRLVRQLLVESSILALVGGLAGILIAYFFLPVLRVLAPNAITSTFDISINLSVLLFTLSITALSGILFGLMPALEIRRTDPGAGLQAARGGVNSGHRLRGILVVAEVALSVMLLISAGLLIRSMVRLISVDPGFRVEGIQTFTASLPESVGGDRTDAGFWQADFFTRVMDNLKAVPGVESIGAVNFLPFRAGAASSWVILADRPEPPPGQAPSADIVAVAGDYFQTLGIPLLEGRPFSGSDRKEAPTVVLINEEMRRLHWPNESPVGRRIYMDWNTRLEAEIVGVVGNIRQRNYAAEKRPAVYWHAPQFPYGFMSVVVRTDMETAAFSRLVRQTVGDLNPDLPVTEVEPLEQYLSQSVERSRLTIQLMGAFSALALILAIVGIYGVISTWVGSRFREIGIRIALGAGRRSLLRLVVGRGLILGLVGLAIGLVGAYVGNRLLALELFQISRSDPVTFITVSALILIAALAGSYLPARRALKVDPLETLRAE